MSGKAKEASIRVDGRLRHLRMDNNALCIVEEQTGTNLLSGVGGDKLTLRVLRALCYGALVSGAKSNGERVSFTVDDVGDWMDQTSELLEAVTALIVTAMPEPVDPPKVQGEETPRLATA